MTKRPTSKPQARPTAAPWVDLDYEGGSEPLLPRARFLRRLTANLLLALGLIAVSLVVGMLGCHYLGGLAWIDAFLNAAMIESGMGPVDVLTDWPAKLFAGFYALYSGLTLVATAGLILAPILHRFMHRFHLEDRGDEG